MLFFLLKHTLCFLNSYASCRYQPFSLRKPPLASAEAKSSMKGSFGIRHLYLAALVTVAILPLSLQLLSISSTRFKIYKGRDTAILLTTISPAPNPMPGTLEVLYKYSMNEQRLHETQPSLQLDSPLCSRTQFGRHGAELPGR